MQNKKVLLEKLSYLYSEINGKRNFGLDYRDEQKMVDEIESMLIKERFSQLNKTFISSNNWKSDHITGITKWDVVNYNQIVCKVKSVYRISYNEASDTYNYEATLIGIFIEGEYNIKFGYYDVIDVLILP